MSVDKCLLENFGVESWEDLPITGDLAKDISIFLRAESTEMCCGPNGCGLVAAAPLLKRALKEIRSLRLQLLGARHG